MYKVKYILLFTLRLLTRRENIESVHCLRDFFLDFWKSGFRTTVSVRDPSTSQVCWSALESKGNVWFEGSIALKVGVENLSLNENWLERESKVRIEPQSQCLVIENIIKV